MRRELNWGIAVGIVIWSMLLAGCAETVYWYIEGPAQFQLSSTMYTPGVTVNIEKDGKMFHGPELDNPALYYTPGEEEEEAEEEVATEEDVEEGETDTDEPS